MDTRTYLIILIDSLGKKEEVLDKLLACTKRQEDSLKAKPVDIEDFEKAMQDKEALIEELNLLDEGFDKIYNRIQSDLNLNAPSYEEYILKLQDFIRGIIEKSTQLKALEMLNKNKLEVYFSTRKNEVKSFKVSSQTATSYYKNMADQHQDGQSYFLDKKK